LYLQSLGDRGFCCHPRVRGAAVQEGLKQRQQRGLGGAAIDNRVPET
jgi:hypothetical protein